MSPVTFVKTVFSNKKMIDSQWANLLGLQVFRIVVARVLQKLRQMKCPNRYDSYVQALNREGCCVIENYLSPEIFEKVKAEFEKAMTGEAIENLADRNHYVYHVAWFDENDKDKYPETIKAFLDKKSAVMQIFQGHEGRPGDDFCRWGAVKAKYERFFLDASSEQQGDGKSVSDVHSDTFQTITKLFFYLNDVSENNAPHVYYVKSQRLIFWRLVFEYINSITKKQISPRVSEKWLKRMGYLKPVLHVYPKNTVIVANVFGYHARGYLKDESQHRDVVYVEYRTNPFR